jgi:hypothetical protein
MQDEPTRETILLAVAKFLGQEVRPLVADPKVSFRLLIAAHLCATVAGECDGEDAQNRAELARLRAIFPDLPDAAALPAMKRAIAEGDRRLAAKIREGLSPEEEALVTKHVQTTLIEKLAVNSPRFDVSGEI